VIILNLLPLIYGRGVPPRRRIRKIRKACISYLVMSSPRNLLLILHVHMIRSLRDSTSSLQLIVMIRSKKAYFRPLLAPVQLQLIILIRSVMAYFKPLLETTQLQQPTLLKI
jgi:uncharacterized membrane protein